MHTGGKRWVLATKKRKTKKLIAGRAKMGTIL